jgi:hypothetical protein
MALIQEMSYRIKMSDIDIHPSKTCFLMVSPDYSAVVTQHLSHSLSMDGEIFHIEAVNVPFPDEDSLDYKVDFAEKYIDWARKWDNFVLIEAGVIRGGNYTWITQQMELVSSNKYYTVALCENLGSKFKSDFVTLYYNDAVEDLHFWWEQPNNHWKFDSK